MNRPIIFGLANNSNVSSCRHCNFLATFYSTDKKQLPNLILHKNGEAVWTQINECRYFDQTIEPLHLIHQNKQDIKEPQFQPNVSAVHAAMF